MSLRLPLDLDEQHPSAEQRREDREDHTRQLASRGPRYHIPTRRPRCQEWQMATCFNTTRPTKFQRRLAASSDCQSLKWSSWIATSHPQVMRSSKSTSTSSYDAPCVRHEHEVRDGQHGYQQCQSLYGATQQAGVRFGH
jgi:hypothetical protein